MKTPRATTVLRRVADLYKQTPDVVYGNAGCWLEEVAVESDYKEAKLLYEGRRITDTLRPDEYYANIIMTRRQLLSWPRTQYDLCASVTLAHRRSGRSASEYVFVCL